MSKQTKKSKEASALRVLVNEWLKTHKVVVLPPTVVLPRAIGYGTSPNTGQGYMLQAGVMPIHQAVGGTADPPPFKPTLAVYPTKGKNHD